MKLSLSRLGAAVIAVIAMSAPAYAGPSTPEVPSELVPPAGNKVFLVAHAEGWQIYRCDPGNVWTLVAPSADLYAQNDKFIGTHYAGPTWQTLDGSLVTATKEKEVNVDPTAINWLLLKKKTSVAGTGGDRLFGTTWIQRLNTVGGRAPAASECDVVNETDRIAYEADYYFWKASA